MLTLLALDHFVDSPLTTMQVAGASEEIPDAVRGFQQVCNVAEDRGVSMARIERFAFYDGARKAFAIVATLENGCTAACLLRKVLSALLRRETLDQSVPSSGLFRN